MKLTKHSYERIAGAFFLTALFGGLISIASVAFNKGWFESKSQYTTELQSAEGVYSGTLVHMSGLKIGKVYDVELAEDNTIKVYFEIFSKYQQRIKEDSYIMVVRPFVIGEKILDITVGSIEGKELKVGSLIPAKQAIDFMDLLSGRRMNPLLNDLSSLVGNFKVLITAFSDRSRTEALVKMFDRLEPLVRNLSNMSSGMVKFTNTLNRKKRLEIMASNMALITGEMGAMIPEFKKQVPNMGQQFGQLVDNLNILTTELKKMAPAIQAIAPDLPRVSVRAVEALDQAVITMKALQKSFFLRGNVEEVIEEESKRAPANHDK